MNKTQNMEFIKNRLMEGTRIKLANAKTEEERLVIVQKYGNTLRGMKKFNTIPQPLLKKYGLK